LKECEPPNDRAPEELLGAEYDLGAEYPPPRCTEEKDRPYDGELR